MSTPVYHYIATVYFDDEQTDAQQRVWLADMRAHLLDVVASDEPTEHSVMYSIDGSDGIVMIEINADCDHGQRQTNIRRVADKLETARLYGPNPLPSPWVTKHRRAG